jgi:hypothetical protein
MSNQPSKKNLNAENFALSRAFSNKYHSETRVNLQAGEQQATDDYKKALVVYMSPLHLALHHETRC